MAAEQVELRWAHARRALGRLALAAAAAVAGFVALVALLTVGVALAVVVLGLFVILAALHLAPAMLAYQHRVALRAATGTAGSSPSTHGSPYPAASSGPDLGDWKRFSAALCDQRRWSTVFVGLLISPVLALGTFAAALGWVIGALALITYPVWAWAIQGGTEIAGLIGAVTLFDGSVPYAVESAVAMAIGVLLLLATPTVVIGAARMNLMVFRAVDPAVERPRVQEPTPVAPRPAMV